VKIPRWIISVFYVAFVAWSLYGAVVPVETYLFRMVHMGFIFALSFLVFPFSKNARRPLRWLDLLLAALGAATIAYALLDLDEFIRRSTVPEPVDFFMGVAAIVLLVEISRRVVGNAFTLVLVGFLLYAYFGRFIPGPISHKGYDLDRIVGHMYMTLEGIFGVPLSVSVSFVTLFVVYGTFMDAAGAGNFWLELSLAVMGSSSSSAGRGAVITTALLVGPQGSGVATTMSVTPVLTSFLSKDRQEWLVPSRIIKAAVEGARNMLPVAGLLAAAGMIVGVFSLTGLGLKISSLIMSLSGGYTIPALFLALLASMIVGLSLPITATYIMTVVMVAPALVKVGLQAHVAHMLAFYFAVLSEVSPPVGLSPSAAAAVTGGNPFRAMMQAWKYSLPAFLVPFFFSASEPGANLLLVGATTGGFILAVASSCASLFFVSLGIVGYMWGTLRTIDRVLLILAAAVMAVIPIEFSIPGIVPAVIGVLIIVRNVMRHRKRLKQEPSQG